MTPLKRPFPRQTTFRSALTNKSRGRRARLSEIADVSSDPVTRNDMVPRLDFVERSAQELILPTRNVRKIEPAHLLEVINSIRTFGFCDPLLIDGENRVLDGVIRVEAAKRLGLSSIPCVQAGHLSASERRLLRLALNRLSEKGRWDLEELRVEFSELIAEGISVETSGFSLPEIDHITIGDDELAEASTLTPSAEATPVTRLGDVYLLGRHRLICGDSTRSETYASLMGGKFARLILTDQPYNVPIAGHVTKSGHNEFVMASGEMSCAEFADFNSSWLSAASRHLLEGGLLGTFIDWRGYPSVDAAARSLGLAQLNLVVWTKTNAGLGSLYRSQHELLPLYKKGTASHVNNVELGKNGRWRSNVWTYPGATSLGSDSRKGLEFHPTVKPVAMLADMLLDVTNRGDVVLDPFLGSGSTLIAAERSSRVCCGIELDPRYVDLTIRRFKEQFGIDAALETSGQTFDELLSTG